MPQRRHPKKHLNANIIPAILSICFDPISPWSRGETIGLVRIDCGLGANGVVLLGPVCGRAAASEPSAGATGVC